MICSVLGLNSSHIRSTRFKQKKKERVGGKMHMRKESRKRVLFVGFLSVAGFRPGGPEAIKLDLFLPFDHEGHEEVRFRVRII